MTSIPWNDLSDALSPDFSYYGKVGLSFWMTTVCSTTIHELGHLFAFYMYGIPVSELAIGSQKGKYIWERNVRFYSSRPTRIVIDFLRPFNGHVIVNMQNLCVWKKILATAAGPVAQLSSMGIVFIITNKHLQESKKNGRMYNPLAFGAFLASGMGMNIACYNFLPLNSRSDGYRIFQDLWAIAKRVSL
jgi:hypothetical protein